MSRRRIVRLMIEGASFRRLARGLSALGFVFGLVIGLVLVTPARAYEPTINYALQCMGCHTPDGAGVPPRVPDVRDTLLPFARMPEGRRFLVQVPGSSQSTLNNDELAKLLNWMIRTLSVDPSREKFEAFTEKEVASYRKDTLVQVKATRERLLAATTR